MVRPAWARAAVGVAAVAAGGRQFVTEKEHREPTISKGLERGMVRGTILILLGFSVSSFFLAAPHPKQAESAPSTPVQKTFGTPEEAAEAFIKAADRFDLPALKEILGPDGKSLVSSEDAVQDKNRAATFAEKAHEKTEVKVDPKNPMRATLFVGTDDWPFPIPIVQKETTWHFDTKAGRDEILFRRIGANELDAIQICRGYVEAQQQYALEKHDNAEVNQYAQRIISIPGKQDGLGWRNSDGSWGGPIGEGLAKALEQGYTNRSQPYHGYFFKILKGQGPAAPLGQMDFVVEGAMIGGFALAAAPAEYRVTGVKTFIVSYQGVVYEKDLGPNSLSVFRDMTLYNPDKTWKRTDDNW